MRTLLREVPTTRTYRYWWDLGAWLDQGYTGTCVGYSWSHWVEDAPVTPTGTIDPKQLYREACLLDPWPENDATEYQFGTNIRAGAKALVNRTLVSEYRWAFDLDTLVDAVLMLGPVVVGTNWYDSMFETQPAKDALGSIREMIVIEDGAEVAGGHAWLLNGVNKNRKTFRMKNSWGRNWGAEGRASISFDDMSRLLTEDGEACIAVQRKP
jgi:hypothetical protein